MVKTDLLICLLYHKSQKKSSALLDFLVNISIEKTRIWNKMREKEKDSAQFCQIKCGYTI